MHLPFLANISKPYHTPAIISPADLPTPQFSHPAVHPSEDDIRSMTAAAMRDLCHQLRIASSGNKNRLINNLLSYYNQGSWLLSWATNSILCIRAAFVKTVLSVSTPFMEFTYMKLIISIRVTYCLNSWHFFPNGLIICVIELDERWQVGRKVGSKTAAYVLI